MMSSSNVVLIIFSIISLLVSITATLLANIVSKERQEMKLEEERLKQEKERLEREEEILKKAKIEVSRESLNKIGVQLKMLPKNNELKIIEVEGKRIFPSTGTDS